MRGLNASPYETSVQSQTRVKTGVVSTVPTTANLMATDFERALMPAKGLTVCEKHKKRNIKIH